MRWSATIIIVPKGHVKDIYLRPVDKSKIHCTATCIKDNDNKNSALFFRNIPQRLKKIDVTVNDFFIFNHDGRNRILKKINSAGDIVGGNWVINRLVK